MKDNNPISNRNNKESTLIFSGVAQGSDGNIEGMIVRIKGFENDKKYRDTTDSKGVFSISLPKANSLSEWVLLLENDVMQCKNTIKRINMPLDKNHIIPVNVELPQFNNMSYGNSDCIKIKQ